MSKDQPTTPAGGVVLDILFKGRGVAEWVLSGQARKDIIKIERQAKGCGCGHPPHPGFVCGRPLPYAEKQSGHGTWEIQKNIRCGCEG